MAIPEYPFGEGQTSTEVAIRNILSELATLRLDGQDAATESEKQEPDSAKLKAIGETLLARSNGMTTEIILLLRTINDIVKPPSSQS